MNKKRALFLDRDGVINIDHGYVYLPEQFEFIDGIFELCKKAIDFGYLIFVVTNQAGIGRGYYTEAQFHECTKWMSNQFLLRGIEITKTYFCPTHPEYGIGAYKCDSFFRKPQPGMLLQAAQEYELDLANSIFVGDKESDIQAGFNAGVGCNIFYCPSNDPITDYSPNKYPIIHDIMKASAYFGY